MSYTDKEIYTDDFLTLEPVRHIYTDRDGRTYESVSRLLSKIQVPFDRQGISMAMAKRNAGKGASADKIAKEQGKILSEWNSKRDNSLDHGNSIHDNLEQYFLYGQCDRKDVEEAAREIKKDISDGVDYKRFLPEKIFYNTGLLYAGSADLPAIRKESRSTPWILDIYDYKTNAEQGIRFDSIDRRKSPPRHYNEYYVGSFSHVEACNYYKYAMQLSVYAYFAMHRYNVRIGRLAIIFVDENLRFNTIPVPFMYYEVIALFDMIKSLKELPKEEKPRDYSVADATMPVSFNFYNDSEL